MYYLREQARMLQGIRSHLHTLVVAVCYQHLPLRGGSHSLQVCELPFVSSLCACETRNMTTFTMMMMTRTFSTCKVFWLHSKGNLMLNFHSSSNKLSVVYTFILHITVKQTSPNHIY